MLKINMKTQICCRCKNEKDVDEFSFKIKIKNIRHKTCKECFKIVRRKWYENHKEKIILKNTKNRKKNTLWFIEYKSTLKCSRCPENHPSCLDFHHLNPNEKDFSVTAIANGTYSKKRILEEIEKCEVLCANCHRKLHYNLKHAPVA